MSSSERSVAQPPLRIAFVTPEPIPGGGVPGAAVLIARGLAALGHEVDCWTTAEARLGGAWADVPGLDLHVVESPFRWGRWYTNSRKRPVATNLVLLGSRVWATPTLVRRLRAAHRARPYDVLYRFSTLELVGFGRLRGLPPIVVHPEVHAAGERRWVRREAHLARRVHGPMQRAAVRAMLAVRSARQRRDIHRAHHVIAPSARFAELMADDYGVPAGHFRVVPNPIDVERFQPRGSDRTRPPVRVLFVGRAAVRKGVDALVELSHRLDDLAGTVELHVIANASLWSDYRPLLDDLNPRVATVLGARFNGHVALELAESDLLIQPSRYEPFALTVAEALASGVPAVATDEVGASEGVDPRCLTVVPAGDVDALERAVRDRVEAARTDRDAEARAIARSEAERLFAPEVVCAQLADALRAVASGTASVTIP